MRSLTARRAGLTWPCVGPVGEEAVLVERLSGLVTTGERQTRDAWRRERALLEASGIERSRIGTRARHFGSRKIKTRVIEFILWMVGLRRRGLSNALALRLTEVALTFPDLPPAFDGYTLLHLSDLHVGQVPGLTERAVALLTGVEVDLAVFTGDVQTLGRPAAVETLGHLTPIFAAFTARDGRVAVLGNHDAADVVPILEGLGLQVLINGHAEIVRGDQRLSLVGTDDVRYFFTEHAIAALRDRPPGFSIALVHSPELADIAASAGHALYLTGHTHGGQIALPGGRPVVTATMINRHLGSGAWRVGAMQGYTSRGIGIGKVQARFNCPGEIILFRLYRGEPAGLKVM